MTPVSPTLPDLPPPEQASRPRRRGLRALAVVTVLLAGLGGAAYVVGRAPFLRWLAIREARVYGVEIDPREVDYEAGVVRLREVALTLDGVAGLRAQVRDVHIPLDGMKPRRIDVTGATIALEGAATERLREVRAWTRAHPEIYEIPSAITQARLTWSDPGAARPWLALEGVEITTAAAGTSLRVAQVVAKDRLLGGLVAAIPKDAATITVDAGRDGPPGRPEDGSLHLVYTSGAGAAKSTAALTLRPFALDTIAPLVGLKGVSPRATVDVGATLAFDERDPNAELEGAVNVTINGWVPPHPRQADGILFGSRTAVSTGFRVIGDRTKASLHSTQVTVGALKLKGGGSADLGSDYATLRVELSGAVPCTEAARSAAVADWGEDFGGLLGNVAKSTLEGAVAVKVRVEADTRTPQGAKITQDIGLGCGLKIPKLF